MDPITAYYHKFFAYDTWANKRALDSARAAGSPAKVLEYLSHGLAAQRVWFARIQPDSPTELAVFPKLTQAQCDELAGEMALRWGWFMDNVKPADYARVITYKNAAGRVFSQTLGDILTHVLNHSTYHRAQAATAVKHAGGKPAVTDFIMYDRELTGQA